LKRSSDSIWTYRLATRTARPPACSSRPCGSRSQREEGGEVQRQLGDVGGAGGRDRLEDEHVHEPVGGGGVAAHHRHRPRRATVAGDKVQETARRARRVAPHHHDRVGLVGAAQRVHRPGEAALGRPAERAGGQRLELGQLGLGEVAQEPDLDRVPLALQPQRRLAQPAHLRAAR
jgi:hypothetical protein